MGINISIWGTIKESCYAATDFSIAYVCSQTAIIYLILYNWFECFPFVFGDGGYGFGEVEQGLVYLFIGVGIAITVLGYVLWLVLYFEPKVMRGELKPEIFMPPGYIAVFALPVCLLWFGWSSNRTHWACPAIATSASQVELG